MTLKTLQNWYKAQCDGDWEHQHGVEIGTLDNPGWSVSIDLEQTSLVGVPFEEIQEMETELIWVACKIEGTKFKGYGGPEQLERILEIFLSWAARTQSFSCP